MACEKWQITWAQALSLRYVSTKFLRMFDVQLTLICDALPASLHTYIRN